MSPSQVIVLATPVFFAADRHRVRLGLGAQAQHLPPERCDQQHQPGHAQPDQRGVHAAVSRGHLHRRLQRRCRWSDRTRRANSGPPGTAGCSRWCSTTSATTGCTAPATRCAIFWAAHVVHHQSQDYNLSTALRQTSSGALLGWMFYLPMAMAGVPPLVFGVVALIDLLYQFWVHTEHVRQAGLVRPLVLLALQPPRAPCGERRLPRSQLRRRPDRLGPPVRQLQGRGREVRLRHAQPLEQLGSAVVERRGLLGAAKDSLACAQLGWTSCASGSSRQAGGRPTWRRAFPSRRSTSRRWSATTRR